MLRWVVFLAGAAVAVLAALAIGRGVFEPEKPPEAAPAAEEAAAPAVAVTPEIAPVPLPPAPPTPDEVQVQEDAAATGMTTMEPEPLGATPDTESELPNE